MNDIVNSIRELLGISAGIALLVTLGLNGLWSIYFNRIKEGQKAEFLKQIENLKTQNDKINYISKTQFDTEFKIYQELSEASFNAILKNERLFPVGIDYIPEDETERYNEFKKRYKEANSALYDYQNLVYKYAAFIEENLYSQFEELRKTMQINLNYYPEMKLNKDLVNAWSYKDKQECRDRTNSYWSMQENIVKSLRKYLKSLKIQEK